MSEVGTLVLRPATPSDVALILALVTELAAYERLRHEVDADASMLAEALFGQNPRVFCDLAFWQGPSGPPEPAGVALWFYNFSTFRGRHGLYLEDLFVRPAFRGKGVGKALLARLAERCVAERLTRLEWSVLDWNEPAIAFYRAQGAVLMDGWTVCRLTGEALVRMAGQVP